MEEQEQLKNLVAQLPVRTRRRLPAVDEHRAAAAESTRLQLSIADKVT